MFQPREVSGEELLRRANSSTVDAARQASAGRRRYLEIAPEHGLYLSKMGHGDDVRFAGIFHDAWLKIPEEHKSKMASLVGSLECPGLPGIRIVLENLKKMRSSRLAGNCEVMRIQRDGSSEVLALSLEFFSSVVDLMPAKHTETLVGHELAHVFQASNNEFGAADRTSSLFDSLEGEKDRVSEALLYMTDPHEQEANRIAKSWGFNTSAMQRWLSTKIQWNDLPPARY